MTGHRKPRGKKGGGWFGEDAAGPGPFSAVTNLFKPKATAPAAPVLPVVNKAVDEVAAPLQTAGKRLKKHTGVNPTSTKSMSRLLGTKKGDKMLGVKRRRTRRKN